MLTKIHLEHFKCFEKLQLPLAPLTLLSGLNASGKSTTMQALSLLHQTAVESEWNTTLILNGSTIALGAAGDVIDKISGRKDFRIGVQADTFECFWTMRAEGRQELSVPISTIDWREAPDWQQVTVDVSAQDKQERIYHLLPENIWQASEKAQQLSSLLIRLAYISADRIGPRETYEATTPDQQTNVGMRGEFTAWFLHYFAEQQPMDGLRFKDTPPTLQRQAEAWMNYFFPGCHFMVQPVERANLVTLSLRTSEESDYHRPQNVGYGLTHVLPIVTACLGAEQGDVLLIENPESHLHPAGQSEMGRFLARTAAAGAQVILETHSDHVLNGVRRAVKEQIVAPDSVAIHFFKQRIGNGGADAQIQSPLIDANGTIDSWPEGFFDQFDKDTSELIDW
jgi:predicted ATPase